MKKVGDKLQAKESARAEYLSHNIPKSEGSGVACKAARATINKKSKPRVADWDALWAYVFKTKATDILQRRISDDAINSRWEAKKKVPGVESLEYWTVPLTKG